MQLHVGQILHQLFAEVRPREKPASRQDALPHHDAADPGAAGILGNLKGNVLPRNNHNFGTGLPGQFHVFLQAVLVRLGQQHKVRRFNKQRDELRAALPAEHVRGGLYDHPVGRRRGQAEKNALFMTLHCPSPPESSRLLCFKPLRSCKENSSPFDSFPQHGLKRD